MSRPRVKRIWQVDDRTLGIEWTTGRAALYDVVELRRTCPCAECVDEDSGERRLDPASVSDDTRPLTVDSVGRYALTIAFTDGHSSGIYPFKRLEPLGRDA